MEGVAAIEVRDPRNTWITVVGSVGVGPGHRLRGVSQINGICAARCWHHTDAGIDQSAEDNPTVGVEVKIFWRTLKDAHYVIRRRIYEVFGGCG